MTPEIARFMKELGEVWDEHRAALGAGDIAEALVRTVPEPWVWHLPIGSGAAGRAGVERFLAEQYLPHQPADLAVRRVTRTIDRFRLVDETSVSFTHDRPLPWLLPEHEPTGRRVEVLTITVVEFVRGRLKGYRTLWDYSTLTAQLGADRDAEGAA